MSHYPPDHHPVFFLINALRELGANAEFVKDSRTLSCWGFEVNGQLAVYLIDNRLPHESEKEDPAAAELLKRGVLVMCAQKRDAERVGGRWLAIGVTPGYGPPVAPLPKQHDVGMVAYIRDQGREQLIRHAARYFRLNIAQGLFGNAAVDTYWRAKVALNVPTQFGDPLAYDVPMRVFEALATGTPLVTNALPELGELDIQDGVTCLTYTDADSMIDAIGRLVKDDALAERIGANGAKLAQERHTYQKRAEKVMEWLNG